MVEIRQMGRGKVVDSLKYMQYFKLYSKFNWEPMKVLEDGGDTMEGGSSADDIGSRVLDRLELMEGFVRDHREGGYSRQDRK